MIKQRLIGLALSLALLGTMSVGFMQRASAEDADVVVVADVSSVLTLSFSPDAVSFGNVDVLGTYDSNSNVQTICTRGTGATYVTSPITATIQSSTAVNLRITDAAVPYEADDVINAFYVGTGAFGDCDHYGAQTLAAMYAWAVTNGVTYYPINPTPLSGSTTHTIQQYYMLDVLTTGLSGTTPVEVVLTYSAEAVS